MVHDRTRIDGLRSSTPAMWLLLLLPLLAGEQAASQCGDLDVVIAKALAVRREAGEHAADDALASRETKTPVCFGFELARLATAAWVQAREAAASGGSPEALAPVRDLLARLATRPAASRDEEQRREYAQAAITAAMAASQDERGEMGLYLVHARSVDERLTLTGPPAAWPLPIDELEGALWLEVDRFREARTAYERAVQRDLAAGALIGLARTQVRLGETASACESYRRALPLAAGKLATEARTYVATYGC